MEGWIKIHRKILENPIVCKDTDTFSIWMYLLLNATHKEIDMVFKGKRITLKPGQLITGRKVIAKQFDISESKVQRILKAFEIEQQIEQQTSRQNRLISIVNWDYYQQTEQQNEQQMNNKRTTSEQQVNTNKNERMKEDIYLYFINKYKGGNNFKDKMNFLHEIQSDKKYKELTPDEEYDLRNYILIGGFENGRI